MIHRLHELGRHFVELQDFADELEVRRDFPFFLELVIEEALRFLAVPIQHDFDEDLEVALNLEELVNEHNDACADEEEGAAP